MKTYKKNYPKRQTSRRFFGTFMLILVVFAGIDAMSGNNAPAPSHSHDFNNLHYNIGKKLYLGEGREQDFFLAMGFLEFAAESGHPGASHILSLIYFEGKDVETNLGKARGHSRYAAQCGIPEAQYNYGQMLLRGDGGPQDTDEARVWLSMAADNQVPYAKEVVAIIDLGVFDKKQRSMSTLKALALANLTVFLILGLPWIALRTRASCRMRRSDEASINTTHQEMAPSQLKTLE